MPARVSFLSVRQEPTLRPWEGSPPLASAPEVERCRREEHSGNTMDRSGSAWGAGVIPGQRLDGDGDPKDPRNEKGWLRARAPAALEGT